jgi:endonuclease/exonuclease/phosphatase family metal-dependent hydrolase
MRIDQAQFVLDQMANTTPCIFAGDTNLRKTEWSGLNHTNVEDAWVSMDSPKAHKVTWQQAKYKKRYDRVWTQGLEISNFETFGKQSVASIDERPSDHYAVRVEFNLLAKKP